MAAKGQCKLTVDEIAARIDGYFDACDKTEVNMVAGKALVPIRKPYTVAGLAVHLGVHRATYHRWATGQHPQDVSDADMALIDAQRGTQAIDSLHEVAGEGLQEDAAGSTLIQDTALQQRQQALAQLAEDNVERWGTHQPVRDLLTRASDRIMQDLEERALTNTYNAKIAAMMMGKNGYSDPAAGSAAGAINVSWQGVSINILQDYSG